MLTDDAFTSSRAPTARRTRYEHLTMQEVNMLLHAHRAKRAMAFYDRLPAEQRELVREGRAVVKGETWQIQGRDRFGRFTAVAI